MNKSELLFESILQNLNLTFNKIPASTIRTPDYEVFFGGKSTYWEVKHIEENDIERNVTKSVSSGELVVVHSTNSKRIENSIKQACDQFKKYGVTDKPCIIVLLDQRNFCVQDFFFTHVVQDLMVGKGHYIEGENGLYEIFRENGIFTNHKKYVSAVAIMIDHNKTITILHNPYAATPILTGEVMSTFQNHYRAVKGENVLEWVKV